MRNNTIPPISPAAKQEDLFLISNEGSYTYNQLYHFANYFSNSLQDYDISAKHPLGLSTHSSDTLVFIIAACWIHGIPFVPLNPDAKPHRLAKQIDRLNTGLIITDLSTRSVFSTKKTVLIDDFKLSKTPVQSSNFSTDRKIEKKNASNIFGYLFTSGTSDKPKIVPLKRRQIYAAAEASAQNLKPATNEAWLLCLPLYHIGGISVVLRSLIYGSAIYRMDNFDEGVASELLSTNQQIIAASFVPTMLKRLINDPNFTTNKTFQGILLGGGPIDTKLLETCINRNIPAIPSYGMTETCAQIAANPILDAPPNDEVLKSVGPVFDPNKVEVRNENREPVTTGNSGIIWLKGPQIFDGYFGSMNNKQLHKIQKHSSTSFVVPPYCAQSDVIFSAAERSRNMSNLSNSFDEDGWFNTGDFGRLDSNGNLYIEARRTDLIITGGENVSPYEVESVLSKMSFIKDAAVFGVPDPEWGQKVVAAIVLKNGNEKSTETIQKALEEKLERYKRPKEIIVVESIPRNETGKINRSELAKWLK